MATIFINPKIIKHLILTVKFWSLNIYYKWKNVKKSCKINKFKVSAPTWYGEFKYNWKKYETVIDNPWIKIYVNKIENRITFKIKTGYYLELLAPETMKLLGSIKMDIDKDENCENLPHLGITEVVLIHCNTINKNY